MKDIFNLKNSQIILNDDDDIKRVYIELTSACNFNCKMCFKNAFTEKDGFMDKRTLSNLKKSLTSLPKLKEVVLGGIGEPLIHNDLKDIVTFLKEELKVYVILATNGYLLEKFSDFFLKKQLDNIVISVDTTDIGHLSENITYKTIKTLIENRKRLKLDKPVISIEVVIDRFSLKDLTETVKKFAKIGVKDVIISNLLPTNMAFIDRTLYPSEDKEILKDLLKVATGNMSMTLPYFSIKTERKCNFIDKKSTVIRWDGGVAPCYRFLHSSKEFVLGREKTIYTHTFGNVNSENLLDIWNKRDYKWFRFTVENALYPSCIDCNFNDSCSFVKDTEMDCWGLSPSCADCLWSRNVIICP
ncbi:tungsten cofactor oxidoreductase radical SAM maturase [Hippea maritima]|uniref:Radical SAM domain protein n=1 Tax=Hippea maritima (strain ATCC 700847 / DSM 10411 / MH2) TaxID=760142 RepID=F2LVH2_HIPMA|nr:tungsten cofactor oxidoreductase radical SAM maturase [Hippea maritima]AEA33756.1 Radical SAM domain protein [Hippea maritima DSM 10411]